ncbi:methionyl-tRNA formyltransferase [Kordiimonas sp. SCSIO 12610]|uniref:methionyl-tRNA formyltransferase n=1 Tax=Kordiimonas sp. SCSIO 12610 TaxID=2829597 RepID=UPI0021095BAC|nr:methionyl-tRNA formyltransferase [Kordiimonas sp. SCSIO 12610]UTW55527.1 methionyl-tRNA formyltransferase [Kordiimonas sp. SCSIO 12610]
MRIAFMGTPDFAVPTLAALLSAGHDVVAVYSQPPRPAGRGKVERKSAVHNFADQHTLPVFTPQTMRSPEELTRFQSHEIDIAVVVAYGQILPQSILDTPKFGCVNVHASLLPRWRGAAPIHRAIMAGDQETGVCIMVMEAGLDTGPVITRVSTPIAPTDTTALLHDKLATMGADIIDQAICDYAAGEVVPEQQAEEGVTYASKIDKAEARIDWTKPALEIDRQIRGLSPFPGAWCELNGSRIKILDSEVCDGSGQAGIVLDDNLTIACSKGALRPKFLQKAGKGVTDRASFLLGTSVPAGTIVS